MANIAYSLTAKSFVLTFHILVDQGKGNLEQRQASLLPLEA